MKKKRLKIGNIIKLIMFIILIVVAIHFILNKKTKQRQTYYIGSNTPSVTIYNMDLKEDISINRGELVEGIENVNINNVEYTKILYKDKNYYVNSSNLVSNIEDVVYEKELYVRTNVTVYNSDYTILGYKPKGSKLDILGYSNISDGNVEMYKINYDTHTGYVYSKYLVDNKEEAEILYEVEGLGEYTKLMDYYPVKKPSFDDNIMPEEVRAIYINNGVLDNIDSYIKYAKDSKIDAFVIDIKENSSPTYKSKVMEKYSKTSYEKASYSIDYMKELLNKLKENNIYAIARIVVGKDNYYALDNEDDLIINNNTSKPYIHNGSTWVSMYSRKVWEYNVELAKEAVDLGFNEIQFDYLRFPDTSYDNLDYKNKYQEKEKSVAIQNFLFYATDEIHKKNAYVSADVFGECAHGYITSYGQYWAAISNVVDVISGMPYPELFASGEYGITYPWNNPYNTLTSWGNYVVKQQEKIPTKAKVRTWIQAYTATWKSNYIEYTNNEVQEEIQALYDLGFNSGFIAWNGGSNLNAYNSYLKAFNKEY